MLPIEAVIPEVKAALGTHGAAVLQAAPGAGKTTGVPPALLGEAWLDGQRIVMLEPRRLATRAAARRIAHLLGESVGATVGFRVRGETRVSARTRIEVVTEGILTRMVQSDPSLDGVGLLIFDEYHERSLDADLALALTLEARDVLRPDLRLLVMSATLDGARVARLLGDAPVITSEGRTFPVDTRYVERRPDARIEDAVTAIVRRSLRDDTGDVLVFLPGAAEIRRTHERLVAATLPPRTHVFPLHGTLSAEAQDQAILPSAPGERKIVLATSIAETSLTIEGVRVVIDAGLARVPRFSPRTGMTRLETVRVSRASADQRRGRAGRVAPGVCYRLWPEHEQHSLLDHSTPAILEADLAPVALELSAAGITDPASLRWLDPPPPAAYAQARELLAELGAFENTSGNARTDDRISPHGRRMLELPLHPRLAHMVLEGARLGVMPLACDLAALASERDPVRSDVGSPSDADVETRLALIRGRSRATVTDQRVDWETVGRIRRESERMQRLGIASESRARSAAPRERPAADAGVLLAFAYPDRIAQLRAPRSGRFLLRNGNGAALADVQSLSDSPYIVPAELDGRRPESRIFLAASITLEAIEAHFGEQIITEQLIEWDARERAVAAREVERLGAIVLAERPLHAPDASRVTNVLLEGLAREGIDALPWNERARSLRQRIAFLHHLDPSSWPDVSDAVLGNTLEVWLGPHLSGARSLADVARVDLASALLNGLPWDRRNAVDELAPTHVVVPSGSRIPIDYSDPAAPVLSVRLQEMFGLADTPRVARGVVPLTVHLLSPARRPVQVTRDLAGFWRSSYFDVRKELRGRYPKHYWPDDPMDAEPTSRAKRRTGLS
ncbi:MAG TPA: ATP-dependent helicase HrpB [Gemmatimonadaceae bacterium]|nr:ATP-dependent helicase HrpB [Gemmatimonadaceae bacterium]